MKIMVNKGSIILIILFLNLNLFSMNFYLNDYSADTKSIAESYINSSENSDSIIFNPAMLVNLNYKVFQWTTANLFGEDINLNSFSYAMPFKKEKFAFGIAFSVISADEQPITDIYRYPQSGGSTGEGIIMKNDEPIILGSFSESRSAIYLSFAKKFYKKFSAGITLKRYSFFYKGDTINDKYINALLNTYSSCLSFDLGLNYFIFENLETGITFSDLLNTGFKWDIENEYILKIPPQLGFNLAYKKIKNLTLAVLIKKIFQSKNFSFKAGIGYLFSNLIEIKTGYDNNNFNIGTGIKLRPIKIAKYLTKDINKYENKIINLEYSLEFNSQIGNTHRISLRFNF
jgi:hypothetical protein